MSARTPSDDEWAAHVDRLVDLLGPLERAGWLVPDAYDSDFDAEFGPHLYGSLWRTWMVIDVEYDPTGGALRLQPSTDVTGEDEPRSACSTTPSPSAARTSAPRPEA